MTLWKKSAAVTVTQGPFLLRQHSCSSGSGIWRHLPCANGTGSWNLTSRRGGGGLPSTAPAFSSWGKRLGNCLTASLAKTRRSLWVMVHNYPVKKRIQILTYKHKLHCTTDISSLIPAAVSNVHYTIISICLWIISISKTHMASNYNPLSCSSLS